MILEIEGLTKIYGEQIVLEDLNFKIEKPAMLALVAPNGTGKTTLMDIICNLVKPSMGKVEIFGQPTDDYKNFYKVCYLQDNSVLYEELNGWDHIQLILDLHKLPKERAYEVADELKMTHYLKKKVGKYSLGMKQYLLFAMSVIPKPEFLLLDEPLNGLDPSSVARVRNILKRMHEEDGVTILFSSHNLDQIDKLTDQVLFLHEGKIISNDDALKGEKRQYKIVTDDPGNFERVCEELNIACSKTGEYKLEVYALSDEVEELKKKCEDSGVIIMDIEINKNQTENLYLELFEEED